MGVTITDQHPFRPGQFLDCRMCVLISHNDHPINQLSFLGFGVLQPTATWGNILTGAQAQLDDVPWVWLFPGVLIILTVLSINFIGDGLRDALDPRSKR